MVVPFVVESDTFGDEGSEDLMMWMAVLSCTAGSGAASGSKYVRQLGVQGSWVFRAVE
ncbi:hypothetical protein [Propioniferax innocua]|uniref:hypothetical protein n=1 Tax=Propioniferax innocua TaxID=1753 RepID=UPI0031DA49A9